MSQGSAPKSADQAKLDHTLDVLIQRVNEIRASLSRFLYKLDEEIEPLSWPSALDSFALISSQLTALQKNLTPDQIASLKSFVFVPIQLGQERDMELEKLTQGRVMSFNHELVPHYLRTKPELDIEKQVGAIRDRATNMSNEQASRQMTQLNKMCSAVMTQIKSKREDWNTDDTVRKLQESSSAKDTRSLIDAVSRGTGLQSTHPAEMKPQPPPSMMPSIMPGPAAPRAPIPNINIGGHPRGMIRGANRMHPYNYQRP